MIRLVTAQAIAVTLYVTVLTAPPAVAGTDIEFVWGTVAITWRVAGR